MTDDADTGDGGDGPGSAASPAVATEASLPAWAGAPPPPFTSWYADAFRNRAAPLRALLVATVPVAVVGVVATAVLQLTGDTLVVNGQLDTLSLGAGWLVVAGVLLLLGFAALALGTAAAGLGAAAVRVGEHRTVRWAVTTAGRRMPALAAYTVLVVVVLALSLAAAVGLVLVHVPTWLALVVAAAVLVALGSPFCLAWPLVLVEGHELPRAIARSWELTWQIRVRTCLKVLVFGCAGPIAALALVRYGMGVAGDQLPVWPWQLVDATVVGALGTVALVLMASVHVGVLFSLRVPVSEEPYYKSPLDPDRVARALSGGEAREWGWLPARPGTVAVAVVVAALLPGLLNGGLLWWNPAHAPSYTSAVVDDDAGSTTTVSIVQPDGSVTVATSNYLRLHQCAGTHCVDAVPRDDSDGDSTEDNPVYPPLAGGSVTADGRGGVAFAGWWTSDAGHEPTLRLFDCRPSDCTDQAFRAGHAAVIDRFHPAGEHDEFNRNDQLSAVARSGDRYVVATLGSALSDRSQVTIYECADVRCANPSRTDVGAVDLYSVHAAEAAIISLAIAPDGRPVLSVSDGHTGAVHLLSCVDAGCGRHTWRTAVAPTMVDTSYELLKNSGAQVAVLPDGRPVIAYREASTGASMLALCRDRGCTATKTRRLTGSGWARRWPALAVDRSGHPMVATFDLHREQLELISCLDAACARTATAHVARWKDGPGNVSLTLDADGHPVVGWGDYDPRQTLFGYGSIRLVHCLAERCGATR